MKGRYKQLLTYVKDAVTRNKSEKSINSILDYISTSQQVQCTFHFVCNTRLSVCVCVCVCVLPTLVATFVLTYLWQVVQVLFHHKTFAYSNTCNVVLKY